MVKMGTLTEYRKIYNRQYYLTHKEQAKKYWETHKGQAKKYEKQYYLTHKEQKKQWNKQYYLTHKEQMKKYKKQYYLTHKEQAKKYKKQYCKENPKKVKKLTRQWKLANPKKMSEMGRREASKRRQLDFNPWNKPFKGCEGHHLAKEDVIYLPKELHRSIHHNIWTGQNMDIINTLAIQFLEENL